MSTCFGVRSSLNGLSISGQLPGKVDDQRVVGLVRDDLDLPCTTPGSSAAGAPGCQQSASGWASA
jgi:hypothetical protein